MKISAECIRCVLDSAMELMVRQLPEAHHRRIAGELLELAQQQDWDASPPEFAEKLYSRLIDCGGHADSFREAKDRSTELALQLLPEMRRRIAAAPDEFTATVKAVIGGNIIDCGVDRTLDIPEAVSRLRGVFDMELAPEKVRRFQRAFERAETVFYVLDNCGEAVFDRLLIERCRGRVTLGVRGDFILNDITRRELAASGLGEFPVLDTGSRTPGVPLGSANPEFLKAMRAADLVIAKGQGNFETLTEFDRPIACLLRVKCPVICRCLARPAGALELALRNCGD